MKKLIAASCLALGIGVTSISMAATTSTVMPLQQGLATCQVNNLDSGAQVKLYSLDKKLLLSLKNSESGSFLNSQPEIVVSVESDKHAIGMLVLGIAAFYKICRQHQDRCRPIGIVECHVSAR
jgi:hypothetical protein